MANYLVLTRGGRLYEVESYILPDDDPFWADFYNSLEVVKLTECKVINNRLIRGGFSLITRVEFDRLSQDGTLIRLGEDALY